jgi:hypothetical protein
MLDPSLNFTKVTLHYDLGPILREFQDFTLHEIKKFFSSFLLIPELPKFHLHQLIAPNTPRSDGPNQITSSHFAHSHNSFPFDSSNLKVNKMLNPMPYIMIHNPLKSNSPYPFDTSHFWGFESNFLRSPKFH